MVYTLLAVRQMRQLQRAYFQNRTADLLEKSMASESHVDKLVARLTDIKPMLPGVDA